MSDLRQLPKVDVLAASPMLTGFSARIRTAAARAAVGELREAMKSNGKPVDLKDAERIAVEHAQRLSQSSLRRVINASGIILHTGLGRARLAEPAAQAIADAARDHSNTELDLESGERGDRQSHVRELLQRLTGAEDALIVNNCAAAIQLSLTALCTGREAFLSRGEMVEIGGSFRMPDIVRASGCRLVEVGCTNKSRLSDYEGRISEDTGVLLRCHPSNFRIVGFQESPSDADLSALAKEYGLLFLHDLGNGCLWDLRQFGLPKETTVQEAISDGADVVTISGDKLLGGPQAGLILGRANVVALIKRHPLARAMRVDKLTLAGLEATLRLHAEGRLAEIPTYRYLARPIGDIEKAAKKIAKAWAGAKVESGFTEVGGGAAPGQGLPTYRVGLPSSDPEALHHQLRNGPSPILGRIEKGLVWLDPRTVEPSELAEIVAVLTQVG